MRIPTHPPPPVTLPDTPSASKASAAMLRKAPHGLRGAFPNALACARPRYSIPSPGVRREAFQLWPKGRGDGL